MANINELLLELNPAQRQAVEHPPQIPLQILAGPGSGKTKVLTMRIAHLIAHCYLPPWAICAVTFTNKAAKEMRERLVKLIGKDITAQIKMGTFHALCAMFLRRYAKYVGIEGNFTVCDADESKKIIVKLLKPFQEFLKEKNITLEAGTVQSMISKVKAKGLTADDALKKVAELNALSLEERKRRIMLNIKPELLEGDLGQVVATVYKNYEKTLRESNSLDFDDLLLFGVKLFESHKQASAWCQHVLVDEYQDTNTTQYELMRYIAQGCRCVTIVGDPDQSIYGWRSAEIENLGKMISDFPETQQIFLEQNYRSTAAILAISMALISQDKKRIQKTLNTAHPQGPTTVLRAFPIEAVEAGFIAAEIKRLVAFAGGLLTYNDFVVLLRFNALSRAIESALRKEGIPSRVLAGHKFFERMEVKDVLAYLQLVDNPAFVPAFTRVVNVPSRSVGEKTVAELLHQAEQLKISPLQVVERIVAGKIPDIKPPVKKKLAHFAGVIRDMRKFAIEGMSPSKLIQSLLDLISYGEHLRKTQPDYESRWDNVQELINFAAEVENNLPEDVGKKMSNAEDAAWEELWGDSLNEWDVDQVEVKEPKASQPNGDTPLRLFLQASMLSTDTDTAEDDKDKEKVTISTCHAAKGLEWAVVMIPAVVDGVFPSSRAEDTDEELRLLYVACTRAQCLLCLSHTTTRMVAGQSLPQDISSFLANVRSNSQTKGLVSEELPALTAQDRTTFSRILNRPAPDEAEVKRRVSEYERTGRHPVWGVNAPFRDLAGAPVNGYAVPARYGAVPGRALDPPQAGQPVYAQQQPQPQRGVPQQEQKPKIERVPDNINEPPLFMASSLVHFNNVHRAGVVQNAQTTTMVSSSSRGKASASASGHAVNAAVPLTSSKNRVVNVAAPQSASSASGSNLGDWIVKTETHRAADAEVAPSKSKGKAKAVEPVRNPPAVKHEPGSSPVKMELSEPSLAAGRSTNSRLAAPPARARARLDLPSGGPGRIKPEPDSGPRLVKLEPRSSSAAVTPTIARPGVSSGPNRVKLEPASDLVKLESSSSSSPLPSRQIKVAPAQMKVEPRHGLDFSSSTRKQSSSALGPVRPVQTSCIKVEAPLKSSPGEGLPSSSGSSIPASNIPTSSSSSPPEAPLSADAATKPPSVKRRLGMGRATVGYSNKKFKPLIPNGS